MLANYRAGSGRSGSVSLSYCFSKHPLCKVNSLLIGLLLGGGIPCGVALLDASWGNPALAQIVPDATLGVDSSVVTPLDDFGFPIDQIDGGARRGANLFHSFSEFSVPSNGLAYFNNTSDIQNIISRVTGGSVSNIDGLIAANGTANLFLINPNGIIFGPNASLNIGGSFVGSTASSLKFADGTEFSAIAPQTIPLLTISVPIGLQYGGNSGSILNQSQAIGSNDQPVGLQVPPGKTLALIGGAVTFDRGRLTSPGSQVELGGLTGEGTVGLNFTGNNLSFSFPDDIARADVYLRNGSRVNVAAGNGGSIAINARNLDISGRSALIAGIGQGLGTASSQAGDIRLNATESIKLRQLSGILNNVFLNATGNSGNLIIIAGSLLVTDDSQLQAITFGEGKTGNIVINARDRVWFANGGDAISRVEQTGIGKGGDIRITTGELLVTNGAQLIASTRGQGKVGSVIVDARDRVWFDGTSSDGRLSSTAASSVEPQGRGNGGDIIINTGSLLLTNGAQLFASTSERGNAGNVIINARDRVWFDGTSSDKSRPSGTLSRVEKTGEGQGGQIYITTGTLSVTNGAQLTASTLGNGNAGSVIINAGDRVWFDGTSVGASRVDNAARGKGGDIRITTRELSVTNRAQLISGTSGQGDAGSVIINAGDRVSFDRESAAFSNVDSTGTGKGGDIRITTRELSVTNGSQLIASTSGQGDAGSVIINAGDRVSFDRESAAFSNVDSTGTGKGGDIRITTGSLFVTNASQLIAATSGQGDAGNVIINARDRVWFDGRSSDGSIPSGAFSSVVPGAVGNGGSISITTPSELSLTNGAELNSSSAGEGRAGEVQLTAGSIHLDRGRITSETASGDGGNIILSVQGILLLRRGSQISTTAGTAQAGGDGGNITIDADFIVAVPKENSDITANAYTGRGGNIKITTQGIYGLEFRPRLTPLSDITASSEYGVNGTVQINTPDVDPSRGLANLPVEPVNVEVAQGCQGSQQQGAIEFFNTGRGGLASNPYEPLSSSNIWEDVPLGTQEAENSASASGTSVSTATPSGQIVEAQGWLVNEQGEVVLFAEVPTSRSQGRCRLR